MGFTFLWHETYGDLGSFVRFRRRLYLCPVLFEDMYVDSARSHSERGDSEQDPIHGGAVEACIDKGPEV